MSDGKSEIEAFREQASSSREHIKAMHTWAIRQSADIIAKAELMEEIDGDIEVYGTDDPQVLYDVADEIEEIAGMVNPYV